MVIAAYPASVAMPSCCVVGGTEFIGRSVVDALLATGRQVDIIGRNPEPSQQPNDNVTHFHGDISDKGFMTERFQEAREIVDLAYSSVPKTSYENPVGDILNNLPASVGMFKLACTHSIKKMVFVSSGGTIYGEPISLPISETHPTNPISPYGITKLALENYAFMFHRLNRLPIICVRPSNPFGVGQMPFVGQGFIATAIASILSGEETSIFGKEGTVRDYIDVDDLARGIVAALDSGFPDESYNIGSGVGRSNLEVMVSISRIAEEHGRSPTIRNLPTRPFDVSANILDSNKLRNISGWQPMADFDESVRRTFNGYLEHHDYQ